MDAEHGRPRLLATEAIRAQRVEAAALLAVGAVHDLNNLLAVIGGALELAATEGSAACGGYLDDAWRAAVRARDLTARIMALSSGERAPGPVDLNAVVTETASLVRLGHRAVKVELQLAEEEIQAFGDESQFRQVVTNLMLNACQASSPGGPAVRVSTRRERRRACLEVTDGGRGMERDALERLFLPLVSGREGGHGLGLAVVRAIVELHEGDIDVWSAPGAGSRFRVWLPLAGN